MLKIRDLIDDAKCYEMLQEQRWSQGAVQCPHCGNYWVKKRGFHDTERHRQRYECHSCERQFDDLTGTVLAGHHQGVKVWVLCLYFMGLNLSNQQIGAELELNKDDVQYMTSHLREGIVVKKSQSSWKVK